MRVMQLDQRPPILQPVLPQIAARSVTELAGSAAGTSGSDYYQHWLSSAWCRSPIYVRLKFMYGCACCLLLCRVHSRCTLNMAVKMQSFIIISARSHTRGVIYCDDKC
jgi:hypothetical protein